MKSKNHPDKIWTVLDVIRWGTEYFTSKQVESPRLTMELLLCYVLGTTRIRLYAEFDRPLTLAERAQLRGYVVRKAHHEPLQYITGIADFYSMQFSVTPDVLIPRQETELLVDYAIEIARKMVANTKKNETSDNKGVRLRCLDIGTGSGCIPIAVGVHVPETQWVATDKSVQAIRVAQENATRFGVADRVDFVVHDFISMNITGSYDLITMNPPYIPQNEVSALEPGVRDYEPHGALTDDADGLTFYRRLAEVADGLLHPEGVIILESGWGQADSIVQSFTQDWDCTIFKDLGGIERVVVIRRTGDTTL